MFEWIWRFLTGWVEIGVHPSCRTLLADLLWQKEIPFWREREADGKLYVRISVKDLPLLEGAACDRALCYEVEAQNGLPVILAFCRRRPGLWVGGLLLLAWCLYSQNLIWDIRIDGCETMSEAEVEAILTEAGCGVGDFYPGIDFDLLHADIRAENPDIAWLSVYMHGTVAEVQMREKKKGETTEHEEGCYANVVASEAGEIVSVRVFEGQAVVAAGDVVMPGELLISGVVPMKTDTENRPEYASGSVMAQVACPITVEVSPEREKKVYTGREKTEKSVKIFKNTINLFANTGIPYATYDTIDMMEEVCLFDRIPIPVVLYSTVYREYEWQKETITPETAAAEAMMQLRKEMDEAIGAGEMLSRTVTAGFSEEGTYRIDCLLYLLRDIAVTEEFSVSPAVREPEA